MVLPNEKSAREVTCKYTLDENDYLTYQLFEASGSKQAKRSRLVTRVTIPILYIVAGLIIQYKTGHWMAIAFFACAAVWFLWYPRRWRTRYRKYYLRHILEHYRGRLDKSSEITLTGDTWLFTRDYMAESKIRISAVEKVSSIKTHFFIKLASGQSLILPSDVDNAVDLVRALVRSHAFLWMNN